MARLAQDKQGNSLLRHSVSYSVLILLLELPSHWQSRTAARFVPWVSSTTFDDPRSSSAALDSRENNMWQGSNGHTYGGVLGRFFLSWRYSLRILVQLAHLSFCPFH